MFHMPLLAVSEAARFKKKRDLLEKSSSASYNSGQIAQNQPENTETDMDHNLFTLRQTIATALFAVIGLALGSFYALVAFRLPRNQPLHAPPSICPHCGNRIWWRDNIPVLGWLLRRGKCRFCEKAISPRYPLIEAATGVAFATIAWRVTGYGWDQHATAAYMAANMVFVSALIMAGAIDSEFGSIPDVFILLGLADAVVASLLLEIRAPTRPMTLVQFGIGLAAGLCIAFALRGIGNILFARQVAAEKVRDVTVDGSFGYGDCKLLAVCGGYLGWRGLFPLLLVATVVAATVGMYKKKRFPEASSTLPFGPFIALGAWSALVFDWSWSGWYK